MPKIATYLFERNEQRIFPYGVGAGIVRGEEGKGFQDLEKMLIPDGVLREMGKWGLLQRFIPKGGVHHDDAT